MTRIGSFGPVFLGHPVHNMGSSISHDESTTQDTKIAGGYKKKTSLHPTLAACGHVELDRRS